MLADVGVLVGAGGVLPLEVLVPSQLDASLAGQRGVLGVEVGEGVPGAVPPAARVVPRLHAAHPVVPGGRVLGYQPLQEILPTGREKTSSV